MSRYIGARYVPKFEGSYDSTTEYENLVVVDNGSGTSYISKKIVPAGTPLTDTNYWAVYGAASGAIINLQNQINDINDNMAFKRVSTPEAYGATGNGLTDDSAALVACIAANDIVICNGTYKITQSITVRKGVTLIGSGGFIVDISGTAYDAFILQGKNKISGLSFTDTLPATSVDNYIISGQNIADIQIENCVFNNIQVGYCAYFEKSDHIIFRHNKITHYSYCGIMLVNGCEYCDISYNYIYDGRDATTYNRYGISLSGYFTIADKPSKFITCNYNHIEDITPLWEGIDSHSCENAEIVGNTIINTVVGISLTSPSTPTLASGNTIKNIIVSNNHIEATAPSGSYGAGILATVSVRGRGVIENLIIENNNITVSGNTSIHSSVAAGIGLRSESKQVVIRNNKVDNGSVGIAIESAATDVMIEGNDISGGLAANDYAITCESVTVIHNLNIIKNYIHNVIRSFRGSTSAANELINYNDNIDNGVYTNIDYTTAPRATLNATTSALGYTGQKIVSNNSAGSNAIWICVAAGSWKAI